MPWLTERQGCCPLCKVSVIELPDEEGTANDAESPPEAGVEAAPPATAEEVSMADRAPAPSQLSNPDETAEGEEEEVMECVEVEIGPVSLEPIEDGEIRLAASSLSTDDDFDDDGIDDDNAASEVQPVEALVPATEVVLEDRVEPEVESPTEDTEAEACVSTNEEDAADPIEAVEELAESGEDADSSDCEEEVEDDIKPSDSEESLDMKTSPLTNQEQTFPFDEHPHDESDPSLMDVPFDERPRDLEASATVWLRAVEDQTSTGDSSKSLSP
mmetsp:Transcript_6655/g.10168  ORF Transcript_6655/g.10168 Transcript_6655/m.10168 type:complete len:272 (+) Transcript_6655:1-816(+)